MDLCQPLLTPSPQSYHRVLAVLATATEPLSAARPAGGPAWPTRPRWRRWSIWPPPGWSRA
jgi:hypothetical protein